VSFITFHKISFALDVYNGKDKPGRLSDYALYILMFPKVLAGPIIKYRDISKQLVSRNVNLENAVYGVFVFSRGLAKKVLIADTLGAVVDSIFTLQVNSIDTPHAWIGILGYTFQLYFDFSGYSDMAIGLARIMGFNFSINFNHPYVSESFTEFWRRWHITLSAWFKDYLYIPLGGNRCSKPRNYFNLWFVFFVSGFWHGANWTFIVWGLYHGTFIVLDKLFWLNISKKIPRMINVVITFCLIMFGWVFFRSESLVDAFVYFKALFGLSKTIAPQIPPLANSEMVAYAVAAIMSFLPLTSPLKEMLGKHQEWFLYRNREVVYMAGTIMLLFFTVSKVMGSSVASFIYFKF
jgi:alginate O-acetyltransferase complex protein AlgI